MGVLVPKEKNTGWLQEIGDTKRRISGDVGYLMFQGRDDVKEGLKRRVALTSIGAWIKPEAPFLNRQISLFS